VTVELDDSNHVLYSRGQTWAEVGDASWSNYTLEVRVKMLTSDGVGHISFRRSGPSRYFIQFHPNGLTLIKEITETFTPLETCKVFLQTSKWYSLKVVCHGDTINVYLDNDLKLSYIDETDPIYRGKIVLESSPDSRIHFDDIKVSTTLKLYIENLVNEAENEIYKADQLDADTTAAEQKLAEARTALKNGDLSSASTLAEEAINLAQQASVGTVSVDKLLRYAAEYDEHLVKVSGTIRDIRFEEGLYSFVVDDGTGVVQATYDGTLGEVKSEDEVEVTGVFSYSTRTIQAESVVEKGSTQAELYTFLIFKDDFEDGDYNDWRVDVDPRIEGSRWVVQKEGDTQVICCLGASWGWTGDTEWADYIIDLRLKLVEGGCGIGFRVSHQPEGSEHYTLSFFNYGLSLIKTELYLKEPRGTELKRVNLDLDDDKWYNVKVVCLENSVEAYIDDALQLKYVDEDNPFLTGFIEIGVFPHDGDEPSHALFDDIKVSRITTTCNINDLITYAQSEIDKAKEINADVASAELKLEQARRALEQEDYQIVQYMVDEVVSLAKRSSIGQIAVKDLRATATLCCGHTVVVTGTVRNLESQYGTGYNFNLNDGTGGLTVVYQGVLTGVEDGYTVRVTGVFDASTESITASSIEMIQGSTQGSGGPLGLTWSIELITTFITIGGAAAGVGGWLVRHERMEKKRKVLFTKLMDEVDAVYSRFKMNAVQCEAELYKLKDEALEEYKEGTINEDKYNILEHRVEEYMKEVRKRIEMEKT
jgi:cytochrome c-type biogenesis protein CcmE